MFLGPENVEMKNVLYENVVAAIPLKPKEPFWANLDVGLYLQAKVIIVRNKLA